MKWWWAVPSCAVGVRGYLLDGSPLGPFLWWGIVCFALGVALGTQVAAPLRRRLSDPTGSEARDPLTGINVR